VSDAAIFTSDKDAQIAELEAALAVARADISARAILINTVRVQIARLKRMQFGRTSEKLDTQIAQLELALEELEHAVHVLDPSRGKTATGRLWAYAVDNRDSPAARRHWSGMSSLPWNWRPDNQAIAEAA
jgi:Transposase C of IS166 homeodomain